MVLLGFSFFFETGFQSISDEGFLILFQYGLLLCDIRFVLLFWHTVSKLQALLPFPTRRKARSSALSTPHFRCAFSFWLPTHRYYCHGCTSTVARLKTAVIPVSHYIKNDLYWHMNCFSAGKHYYRLLAQKNQWHVARKQPWAQVHLWVAIIKWTREII